MIESDGKGTWQLQFLWHFLKFLHCRRLNPRPYRYWARTLLSSASSFPLGSFKIFIYSFIFMCMCMSPHECICSVCMLEAKGMHWRPEARVTDDCEPPYGCWESPSVLNPRTIPEALFFVILMTSDDPEI